ncbi:hypothetical protein [Aurantiacibacter hainanensis]
MTMVVLVVLVLSIVLGVAWYDGGRQEERLIVEPVALPESAS